MLAPADCPPLSARQPHGRAGPSAHQCLPALSPREPRRVEQAALEIAESEKAWLMGYFTDTELPNMMMAELAIGQATDDFTNEEGKLDWQVSGADSGVEISIETINT